MLPTGTDVSDSTTFDRAAARLAKDPRVIGVYGFGSRARGEAGPRSDVDLAVVLDGEISLAEELRLRAEVVEELRRDDVDLVLFNRAPPLLKYEIVGTGKRLFSRDDGALDRLEARAALQCFDTAYLRETQRRLAREGRG
jgi:uncharacterized protein